ncbi:hypothetical protein C8R47DRAFT_1065459 [Mycena vitilis]|nr:hypothetical protein C8R47DRAFT_1065459 [Mycena vitilis]
MAPYATDSSAYVDAAQSLYDPVSSPIASVVHHTAPESPDTGLRQLYVYLFILLGAFVLGFGYTVAKYCIRKWRSKAAVDDEEARSRSCKSLPASTVEFTIATIAVPPPSATLGRQERYQHVQRPIYISQADMLSISRNGRGFFG